MLKLIMSAAVALMLMPAAATAQDFDAGLQAYHAQDYATALREWTPLAEEGHAAAQFNLGLMYEIGHGVPQDHAEAVRWIRMAAEQGIAVAQYNLGLSYANGRGVPQDYATAHMWLNIAGANGHRNAIDARDVIAEWLTPDTISEAQRRARACMVSNYQDCD